VLLSRGPDAVLTRGQTLEMVLDRAISFEEGELNFGDARGRPSPRAPGEEASSPSKSTSTFPLPGRK
jgi:hypothetical protein